MEKIELDIVALSHTVAQSSNYAVVLGEVSGDRRLPIVIGSFEAQAIAVALEGMASTRPLTHDLFKNTLDAFNIKLTEVIISNLLDGVFYSRLVCFDGKEEVEIDSRTSDAIAMAVRFDVPIYTYEFILDNGGVVVDEDSDKEKITLERVEKKEEGLSSYSLKELQMFLNDVLENEDFEKAAEIRDELERRKEH